MKAKKWSTLKRKRISEKRIVEIRRKISKEVVNMNLKAVRELVGLTQEEVAKRMGAFQPEVSRAEQRDDHLVSTLRHYIHALGGELEVVAHFGDKSVRLRGV